MHAAGYDSVTGRLARRTKTTTPCLQLAENTGLLPVVGFKGNLALLDSFFPGGLQQMQDMIAQAGTYCRPHLLECLNDQKLSLHDHMRNLLADS